MESRFRSWWQQIKQHRVATGVVGIALVVVIALIIAGYWFDWTGFNGYSQVTIAHTTSGPSAGTVVRTEVYQPGKALWDWMQLLIIPAVLVVGGFLLNYTTGRNERQANEQRAQIEREAAEKRAQTERDVALDNQREAALQDFIDNMSELLLHEKLRESSVDDEVRNRARVRTLTVLPRLDGGRKKSVVQFLYESGLIEKGKRIVDLDRADLNGADLSVTNLSGSDLSLVNLSGANLFYANLSEANLYLAVLTAANLGKADLSGANLEQAFLDGGADLRLARLSGANLQGTILEGTNLQGTKATSKQLDKATFLDGVTMPDGSKHA